MLIMEKHEKEQKGFYQPEDIKKYLSEVRLMITDSEGNLSDEEALEKIEIFVFSLEKAQSCSHRENRMLIERLFLSLRREMDILQPYVHLSSERKKKTFYQKRDGHITAICGR